MNKIPDQPQAVGGVIDLRGWDFQHSRTITLHGEWEFYPNALFTQATLAALPSPVSAQYLQVPGSWGSPSNGQEKPAFGYGTYRLRILVDQPLHQPYVFWFHRIETSSLVEVNGERSALFGLPAERAEDYRPKVKAYTADYIGNGVQEIELLIQAANYDNPSNGGLIGPVRFGSQAAVDTEHFYSIGFQFVVFFVFLLHALYAFLLFMFSGKQGPFLTFFLLLLFAAMFVISDHERLLQLWLSLNYTWDMKIRLISYMWMSYFNLKLMRSFAGPASHSSARPFRAFTVALSCYTGFILVVPVTLVHYTFSVHIFTFFYLLPLGWSLVMIILMIKRNVADALYILFALSSIIASALGGIFFKTYTYDTQFYPIDILAAMVGFSAYGFKRFFRNAKERDELNERLRESDRRKDQFLANTSHELRTPLHGIMNIALAAARRGQESQGGSGGPDLELLIRLSSRMSRMLDDLLDAARLQDGRIRLDRKPLQMQSVALGVIGMLDFMLRGRPVRLEMNIQEETPPVWADEQRIIQVIYNLLHNAIKFTEQGVIVIRAEVQSQHLVIEVADTGVGMEKDTMSRIFKPYEQGAIGIENGSGVGLGLSICKQLVELHGGELTVRSEPGRGSSFTFQLPLADASQLQNLDAASHSNDIVTSLGDGLEEGYSSQYTGNTEVASSLYPSVLHPMLSLNKQGITTILAVDDDPVNLNVLTTILTDETIRLRTAASGDEAIAMLDEEQWDLVITDVMMPGMSGYELTKRIRERFSMSELPVLLLTARSQLTDTYTGFSSGANDYVTKPVDALELQYRIWSLTMLKKSVDEGLRMEAASLQAQIQPHFLFNALNSILALSSVDLERMNKLGEAFTSYLRISYQFISAGKLVRLSQELELVDAYLYIEKERFEDRLSIVWDADRDLQLLIPPLTIQPLVENAVKHGAVSRAKGGTVTIRITVEEGCALIEVRDNGAGIPAEKLHSLLLVPSAGQGSVGLYNTNRRLKQIYGQGLRIASKPGEGTTVSFIIPMRREAIDPY
ncbi:ATP-binding protein [Paenibacillus sp. PL2-23]|uniref:ATP-binding protein n=1 Tax=Paenibacillus sp. PL2-23 TaxID=2100729 RepID=UPI0030F55ECF